MPIYEFTAPDGKTYEVEGPEGSTKEQAFQRLQQQISGGQAAPTNAASAAPVAAPPVPGAGKDPNWKPTKREIKAGPLSGASTATGESIIPGVDQSTMENFLAGVGETGVDSFRKAKKLGYGLGDFLGMDNQQELAALDDETREARKVNESLQGTVAGQAGQVTGDVLQAIALTAATGGVVNPALSGAARLAGTGSRIAKVASNPLARAVVTDTLAGGAQGALQDTTSDESTLKNALGGAGWGAAIPGGGALLGAAKKKLGPGFGTVLRSAGDVVGAVPIVGAPIRGVMGNIASREATKQAEKAAALRAHGTEAGQIRSLYKAELGVAERAAKRQEAAINKAAGIAHKEASEKLKAETMERSGATIEKIGKEFSVRSTPELAKALRNFGQSNSKLLADNPDLARTLDQLSIEGARMPGNVATLVKSKIGSEARASRGGDAKSLHELERLITNNILDSLPAKRAAALREAFEDYGRAAQGKLKPPAPKPVVLTPNVPKPVIPAAPIAPEDMPYSRDLLQSLITASGRGATLPRDD